MEKKDSSFQILMGLAILMVMCGHLDLRVLTVFDLFPYYSFHVMIFVFISGYFYKEKNEKEIGYYILRKAKHLLLPYYIWNLIYGILVTILQAMGFGFGSKFTLKTFLISPFIDGHQFMLHFAAWFVPALFVVQVVNVLLRKVLGLLRIKWEWLILVGTLLVGILTVYFAIGGHVWGVWKFPGRILFMLPIYEFGICYRKNIKPLLERMIATLENRSSTGEKHRDTDGVVDLHKQGSRGVSKQRPMRPIVLCFMILTILVIQCILVHTCNGLAYSVVWVASFANGPVIPFVTSVTGIAFWLMIAQLLEKVPYVNRALQFLGDNSFHFMMHHIFGFFLTNTFILGWLRATNHVLLDQFDMHSYRYLIDYLFVPEGYGFLKWLYLLMGIGVSIVFCGLHKKCERLLKNRFH